jgi:hypothetical protein
MISSLPPSFSLKHAHCHQPGSRDKTRGKSAVAPLGHVFGLYASDVAITPSATRFQKALMTRPHAANLHENLQFCRLTSCQFQFQQQRGQVKVSTGHGPLRYGTRCNALQHGGTGQKRTHQVHAEGNEEEDAQQRQEGDAREASVCEAPPGTQR